MSKEHVLSAGFDINTPDNFGRTCLHAAASGGWDTESSLSKKRNNSNRLLEGVVDLHIVQWHEAVKRGFAGLSIAMENMLQLFFCFFKCFFMM